MENIRKKVDIPGFRFHPTEEELLEFYLRHAAAGKKLNFDIIPTVNLYLYEPWDLPALSRMGELEWYFFVPREPRHCNRGRPNRTTDRGFWKATGTDRHIRSASDPRQLIGMKKTLVYYIGRAPRGRKTDWIMNEYRLPIASNSIEAPPPSCKEDIVLCRLYRKATSLREIEQRAATEEETRPSLSDKSSAYSGDESLHNFACEDIMNEAEEEGAVLPEATEMSSPQLWTPVPLLESSEVRPPPAFLPNVSKPAAGRQLLTLQVPSHGSFDWSKDPFIYQLRSSWPEQWSPLSALLDGFLTPSARFRISAPPPAQIPFLKHHPLGQFSATLALTWP